MLWWALQLGGGSWSNTQQRKCSEYSSNSFHFWRKNAINLARAIYRLLGTFYASFEVLRVLWGVSNFWVSERNPMMWPFKLKLSACTYTWCYFVYKTCKLGRNLLWAKFDSEMVKQIFGHRTTFGQLNLAIKECSLSPCAHEQESRFSPINLAGGQFGAWAAYISCRW